MTAKEEDDRTYKGVVVLVDDVQLIHFLTTKYPKVLEEFYEEVHRNENTPDTEISDEGLSSNNT